MSFFEIVRDWVGDAFPGLNKLYLVGKSESFEVFLTHADDSDAPERPSVYVFPPEDLVNQLLAKVPKSGHLAYEFDLATGDATEIPKYTDQRVLAVSLADRVVKFRNDIKGLSIKPLGKKSATTLIKALDENKVIGGSDIYSTYDSLSFGGALLKRGENYIFCHYTHGQGGNIDIVKPFYQSSAADFQSWLPKQSELSLAWGPAREKSKLAPLNMDLIKRIRALTR